MKNLALLVLTLTATVQADFISFGVPNGDTSPLCITDHGVVGGVIMTSDGTPLPFQWQSQFMGLPGDHGAIFDANDSVAVGLVEVNDSYTQATLWQNGQPIPLTIPGALSSCAGAINGNGAIVGWVMFADRIIHPFLWKNDVLTLLEGEGEARDINDTGLIIGQARFVGHADWLPCFWLHGRLHRLGRQDGVPTTCNNKKLIVGYTFDSGHAIPCFWRGMEVVRQALLPGTDSGIVWAVNDAGDAVGECYSTTTWIGHAVLWHHGRAVNLDNVPGWTLSAALAINRSGQITGIGRPLGETHWQGFVLSH